MRIPLLASKIDLSNQGLTTLPEELFRCKNLKKLNLSNNKLKVIPTELSELKQLKNLDLSHNEISALYSKNFDFKKLQVLILKNNKIKHIPKQIVGLVSLRKFNIADNQIQDLPFEIINLKNLNSINIANNTFSEFPKVVLKLPALAKLWVNNNPFSTFPISELKESCLNLKALYCFSRLNNQVGINLDYQFLQKQKGNCLTEFNLLSLKAKNLKSLDIMQPINGSSNDKKSLFISYSHADKEWLKKINLVLQTMAYEGLQLDTWDDTRLNAGDLWKKEIEAAINKASIAILIVSNDFLASKFVQEKEVPALLKKAEEKGATILPIIVGYCRFTKSILKDYQAVNSPDKPLSALQIHEQEKVIYELTLAIDNIFNKE